MQPTQLAIALTFAIVVALPGHATTTSATSGPSSGNAPIVLRADLYRTNAAGTNYEALRQVRPFDVEVTLLDAAIGGAVLHSERLRVVPLSGATPSLQDSGQVNVPGRVTGPVDLVLGGTASAPLPAGLLGTVVWYTTQVILTHGSTDKPYAVSPPKLVPPQTLAADLLRHLRVVELPIDDLGNTAKAIRFEGVNVQIVNGLGATNGDPDNPYDENSPDAAVNGLGNLIVGYNEPRPAGLPVDDDRTGSHTIVVGLFQNYRSFGGLLAGTENETSGHFAIAIGGKKHVASGSHATVVGGYSNDATGINSTIAGGWAGTASGDTATVSGGMGNLASGSYSKVSGGWTNTAEGQYSTVGGGSSNEANNTYAAVNGGHDNVAAGRYSAVNGGRLNTAGAEYSTLGGGWSKGAWGIDDWVAGWYWTDG